VSDSKVVPFRSRPPSEAELEAYLWITRHWSPTLRQMLFPEYFKREEQPEPSSPRR
jgi:hypothetical protein